MSNKESKYNALGLGDNPGFHAPELQKVSEVLEGLNPFREGR
jgi:hypothetical protein